MTWSPKMTQRALDAGVDQIAFSIDGLQPAHDRIRGVEGAFYKVLDGIDACVAAGLRVGSVTHITRLNFADLEALHALLGEHGVRVWQVQQGVPTGNLSDEPELVLPNESMLELMPRLGAMARSGKLPKVFAADNIGYYGDDEQVLRGDSKAKVNFWVGCRAGLDVVGIESHGDVKGCLSLPSTLNGRTEFVEGNLRERSLVELWNDANTFAYNRQFKPEDLGGNCKECEFGEICRGGCTVTSVAHHGRPHHFPNCYYHLSR
ncbi:MAG: hypothetical protein CO108_21230 [Deltaproteobacteria bacterium CG_4_9_14_3_um_filter_63_12]|nr:MAG: hypothetical protein CO108_21230 [Deltaproteobacteria bacterium CG_4_9_14_3_um_filter_63_12]